MVKPIYLLNGPNLNLLGSREPEIYGTTTLDDLHRQSSDHASTLNLDIDFRQSNSESALIGWIHEAREKASGIIINAGAYTHTSIAILDALQAADLPIIELHLSNIFARENFRHHSYISQAANGVICGFGASGYRLAVSAMAQMLNEVPTASQPAEQKPS